MDEQTQISAKAENRFASRKFMLVIGVWVGGTIGWGIEMMDAAQWIDFTKYMVALYMAGNVGGSLVDVLKARNS